MFILISDYEKFIKLAVLNQIIEQESALLDQMQRVAIEEATSYLNNRYDTAQIFSEFVFWDSTLVYTQGQRIIFKAADFSAASTYAQDALVSYQGSIYLSLVEIDVPGEWNSSQWQSIATQESLYFVTAVQTTAGTLPTNEDEYKTGDTRNPTLLMYTIDLQLYHLHCRLNPRQIPEIRVKRYDASVDYLKDVAEGVVTPNLPLRISDEKEVMNFRIGSNQRFKTDY